MKNMIRARLHEIEKRLHRNKLIIFPYGKGGQIIEEVLQEEFNIKPYLIIDNAKSENSNTIEKDTILKEISGDDFMVLVASSFYYDIKDIVASYSDIQVWNVLEGRLLNSEVDFVYKGVKVGSYTYGYQSFIGICKIEKIGRFCSINGTAVAAGNHPMEFVSTHPFIYKDDIALHWVFDEYKKIPSKHKRAVVIGNDVWIGANAVVLEGVHVGDGAIIGAGSVVTKDVPDYAVVVGNPARVLRYRYSDEIIEKLKKIQWWNWDIEKIRDNHDLFYDIEAFVSEHY